MKPGPKKGYKQSAEHIEKRKQFGADHPNWEGDDVTAKGGRTRAQRLYPNIGPCSVCGSKRAERHHRDDNPANNVPSNIAILCRKCHMREDGRLAKISADTTARNKAVLSR
jgi:5-methylcytosine-specific restriction endonuclease McrA